MKTNSAGNDSIAIVLLCSNLALNSGEDLAPLSTSAWNELEEKMQQSRFKAPGELLGATSAVLESGLGVTPEEATKIAALLDRAVAAAFALENLSSEGIHVMTRIEPEYPLKLKETLKTQAPPVLYYSGNLELAVQKGIAVVGSRAIDSEGEAFAARVASLCAHNKLSVISGGAKGVDITSMKTALDEGGTSIGVMSDSLGKKVRDPFARQSILDGRLLLLSPFHPKAGFHVANAMSRNKSIYALSEYAFVVASDVDKGGTWAGATENLRKEYAPLFVRSGEGVPQGNMALIEKGGIPIPDLDLEDPTVDLLELCSKKITGKIATSRNPEQLTLH